MLILCLVIVALLLVIAATKPFSTNFSDFELRRREKAGLITDLDLRRANAYTDILIVLRLEVTVLLVLLVPVAISAFGWVIGILLSVVVALEYQTVARFGPIRLLADKLYKLYEPYLLSFSEKAKWFFRLFASTEDSLSVRAEPSLSSKEELKRAIKNSPEIISEFETRLIKSALKFESKLVGDIMTPRSMIDSIDHKELLGPITLTDLHKTGHSRFPVTDGDIDHIVGILYVRNLLTVDGSKNSKKVSQVMDKEVCFVREDQTLDEALAAFLKTQKLLFVVINEFRETVGVLSMEDVIEALLGQRINDEFEQHSSLRAVAERNPRKNNSPASAKDV